jgi:hypothetical protein
MIGLRQRKGDPGQDGDIVEEDGHKPHERLRGKSGL